jgi:hypothetical protein
MQSSFDKEQREGVVGDRWAEGVASGFTEATNVLLAILFSQMTRSSGKGPGLRNKQWALTLALPTTMKVRFSGPVFPSVNRSGNSSQYIHTAALRTTGKGHWYSGAHTGAVGWMELPI